MEMKVCRICKEVKPLEDFSIKRASKDGRNGLCKECDKRRIQKSREENPVKANEISKRSKLKHYSDVRARANKRYAENSVQIMGQMKQYLKDNPERGLLRLAKQRCKKSRVACTITQKDILIPEFCPILSVKLEFGDMATRDNSPSLDRIIPELGYIPGNVAVISFRANRIKNEGSFGEHRKIADWMESQLAGAA